MKIVYRPFGWWRIFIHLLKAKTLILLLKIHWQRTNQPILPNFLENAEIWWWNHHLQLERLYLALDGCWLALHQSLEMCMSLNNCNFHNNIGFWNDQGNRWELCGRSEDTQECRDESVSRFSENVVKVNVWHSTRQPGCLLLYLAVPVYWLKPIAFRIVLINNF